MEDTIISFETAKLAAEKKFDEKCIYGYDYREPQQEPKELTVGFGQLGMVKNSDFVDGYLSSDENNSSIKKFTYCAPTQSLLRKWLREVHGIFVEVSYLHPQKDIPEIYTWTIYFKEKEKGYIDKLDEAFSYSEQNVPGDYLNGKKFIEFMEKDGGGKTYEEALEKGLRKALSLIKLNKIKLNKRKMNVKFKFFHNNGKHVDKPIGTTCVLSFPEEHVTLKATAVLYFKDTYCKAKGRKASLTNVLNMAGVSRDQRKEIWKEYFKQFKK